MPSRRPSVSGPSHHQAPSRHTRQESRPQLTYTYTYGPSRQESRDVTRQRGPSRQSSRYRDSRQDNDRTPRPAPRRRNSIVSRMVDGMRRLSVVGHDRGHTAARQQDRDRGHHRSRSAAPSSYHPPTFNLSDAGSLLDGTVRPSAAQGALVGPIRQDVQRVRAPTRE
jgi:hypothetical protein